MIRIFNKLSFIVPLALGVSLIYFFTMLCGKYFILNQDFSVSEKIFRIANEKKGYLISLLENKKFDKAYDWIQKNPDPELEGIYAWATGDYVGAYEKFNRSGNSRYLAYVFFVREELAKARELAKKNNEKKLLSYLFLKEGKYKEAAQYFIQSRDYLALFSLFLKLKNYPTALYYLTRVKTGETSSLADLIQSKEKWSKEIPEKDRESGALLLQGDIQKALQRISFNKDTALLPVVSFLEGDWENFISSPVSFQQKSIFLDSLTIRIMPEDFSPLLNELSNRFEQLKVFYFLPDNLERIDYKTAPIYYLLEFGLGFLIVFFLVSLFYLYKKYTANQVIERQKELEKMDALSIARSREMEAKKKRDKTELNVSSFVTLNIQLEVLDAAYTKLGLRVDTKSLAEQIEKTKIPNISYKVYKISDSYGLRVKMLSVQASDLIAQKQEGVVLLVLKGDLLAMLKNADNDNAYLQFSQKDSRKVPYSALKLSWEGNIIILNMV
ncbi:MAG: hypothetical protein JW774_06485 [Candidatus Aureabacteria bacterium]|nr:hypothetical protein [Candidatus Auribacterota bacterium]